MCFKECCKDVYIWQQTNCCCWHVIFLQFHLVFQQPIFSNSHISAIFGNVYRILLYQCSTSTSCQWICNAPYLFRSSQALPLLLRDIIMDQNDVCWELLLSQAGITNYSSQAAGVITMRPASCIKSIQRIGISVYRCARNDCFCE